MDARAFNFCRTPSIKGAVTPCRFDALFVGGKDIRANPLLERKEVLKALLPRDLLLRFSEHVLEYGKREFAARRLHEEGVITSGDRTLLLR